MLQFDYFVDDKLISNNYREVYADESVILRFVVIYTTNVVDYVEGGFRWLAHTGGKGYDMSSVV